MVSTFIFASLLIGVLAMQRQTGAEMREVFSHVEPHHGHLAPETGATARHATVSTAVSFPHDVPTQTNNHYTPSWGFPTVHPTPDSNSAGFSSAQPHYNESSGQSAVEAFSSTSPTSVYWLAPCQHTGGGGSNVSPTSDCWLDVPAKTLTTPPSTALVSHHRHQPSTSKSNSQPHHGAKSQHQDQHQDQQHQALPFLAKPGKKPWYKPWSRPKAQPQPKPQARPKSKPKSSKPKPGHKSKNNHAGSTDSDGHWDHDNTCRYNGSYDDDDDECVDTTPQTSPSSRVKNPFGVLHRYLLCKDPGVAHWYRPSTWRYFSGRLMCREYSPPRRGGWTQSTSQSTSVTSAAAKPKNPIAMVLSWFQ